MPTPPRETIYERILRIAQERRDCAQQRLSHQLLRIERRIRTHGHDQAAR